MDDVRGHDLRHTAVALSIKQGAHPNAIKERMGPSSITVTLDRYGHLFPSLGRELAEGLDAELREALANKSVDAICERAEVGRATFFRAFGSKFGLLHEFNRRLSEAARDASTNVGPALDRLEVVQTAIARAWTEAGPGAVELGRAFVRGETVRAGSDVHPELIELVGDILRAGQATGEIRTDLPPCLLAWLWVTAVAGVVASWLEGNVVTDLSAASTAIADLLSAGLRRPGPKPPPRH